MDSRRTNACRSFLNANPSPSFFPISYRTLAPEQTGDDKRERRKRSSEFLQSLFSSITAVRTAPSPGLELHILPPPLSPRSTMQQTSQRQREREPRTTSAFFNIRTSGMRHEYAKRVTPRGGFSSQEEGNKPQEKYWALPRHLTKEVQQSDMLHRRRDTGEKSLILGCRKWRAVFVGLAREAHHKRERAK